MESPCVSRKVQFTHLTPWQDLPTAANKAKRRNGIVSVLNLQGTLWGLLEATVVAGEDGLELFYQGQDDKTVCGLHTNKVVPILLKAESPRLKCEWK